MEDPVHARVREYAEQAVAYVRRAVGVALEYDSDTLPLLDHYLRTVPELSAGQPATLKLVLATSGAYFGEVVRRLGGPRVDDVDDGVEPLGEIEVVAGPRFVVVDEVRRGGPVQR